MKRFFYKILPFFSIFLFSMFIFTLDCSASTEVENLANSGYKVVFGTPAYSNHATFPSHSYEYLIREVDSGKIYIAYTSWEMCLVEKTDGTFCLGVVTPSILNYDEHSDNYVSDSLGRYYYSTNYTIDEESKTITLTTYYSYQLVYVTDIVTNSSGRVDFAGEVEILASSLDIYKYDSSTNSLTEQVFPVPLQGILAPIVAEAPLAEVMKEILEILPVILMTIVGLISLRKGLQLLSTVLHRS